MFYCSECQGFIGSRPAYCGPPRTKYRPPPDSELPEAMKEPVKHIRHVISQILDEGYIHMNGLEGLFKSRTGYMLAPGALRTVDQARWCYRELVKIRKGFEVLHDEARRNTPPGGYTVP